MNRLTKSYNPPELSLDELRAYQAGQLSGPARNRVERLMLDNPFYADALDGLEALQQMGSSLQVHTHELHEALEERVHESATTRRLMPLWMTSLVASVLLVISVAIYLIFRPTAPPQRTDLSASGHIEPGTVLIDPADLGPSTDVPAPKNLNAVSPGTFSLPAEPVGTAAPSVNTAVGRAASPVLRRKKQLRHQAPLVEKVVEIEFSCTLAFPVDEVIVTPPADPKLANRPLVNTERAFLR